MLVTEQIIEPLPAVVQKWLQRANVLGAESIHTVHLHQRGEIRISPHGKWMPFEAEQYNTIESPAFIWLAKVKAAPLITLTGRDKYQNGKGEMLIRLLHLIPIVHAKGPEIDQGALLRYMAEIVWFPSATLADYFSWEQVSSLQAKATMTYGRISATGIFTFDSDGDVQSFEALRYYQRKEGATLESWSINIDSECFMEFQGVRIPAKATVTWKLKEGDFTWLTLEITQIEYNKISDLETNRVIASC